MPRPYCDDPVILEARRKRKALCEHLRYMAVKADPKLYAKHLAKARLSYYRYQGKWIAKHRAWLVAVKADPVAYAAWRHKANLYKRRLKK